jgi:hypothetical protein
MKDALKIESSAEGEKKRKEMRRKRGKRDGFDECHDIHVM